MDLDLKLDGVRMSDIIAVRQFYSGIGEMCYNAGLEVGDLDASRATERRLITKVRSGISGGHMERVVLYVLGFLGGKYCESTAQETRAGLETVIDGSSAN